MRGKQAGKLNLQVRDLREVACGRWRSEAGSTARGEVVPDGELPCVFVSSRLVSIGLVSSVVVVLEAWFFLFRSCIPVGEESGGFGRGRLQSDCFDSESPCPRCCLLAFKWLP